MVRRRSPILSVVTLVLLSAVSGCGASSSTTAFKPADLGTCIAFGNSTVYYQTGVEPSEAQKTGDLLVREKYFGEQPATVQLRYQNRRYEVRCCVRAGAENSTSDRGWREMGDKISRECFRTSPVDIHLCDEQMKTLRTIPHNPIKPELPVRVTFRPSIGGGSLVAQYRNTSSTYLTVVVTLRNATVADAQRVTLNIGPNQTTEHGWAEGWSYRTGETISIRLVAQ